MRKEFWQSNFWKKTRSFLIVRVLSILYKKYLLFRHIFLTLVLKPFYSLKARNITLPSAHETSAQVIVSLTTYPKRINAVDYTLCSIFSQSILPNKIVLTLIENEFPNGEKSIPSKILKLKKRGLEILWAQQNLKPHNKYYYTMEKYSESIIVTVDDDILYPRHTIKKLLNGYQHFPSAISAISTLKFKTEKNIVLPYSQAIPCYDTFIMEPRFDLCAEGYAGVLYPPNILPRETFNKENILECAPIHDDLWLKYMELLANIPVVCVARYKDPVVMYNVQKTALLNTNSILNKSDVQQQQLIKKYNIQDDFILGKIRICSPSSLQPTTDAT